MFYCIFGQINAVLVSRRDFFKNKNKSYSKHLTGRVHEKYFLKWNDISITSLHIDELNCHYLIFDNAKVILK